MSEKTLQITGMRGAVFYGLISDIKELQDFLDQRIPFAEMMLSDLIQDLHSCDSNSKMSASDTEFFRSVTVTIQRRKWYDFLEVYNPSIEGYATVKAVCECLDLALMLSDGITL